MKTRSQKLISLVLVLMMLVSMIPMGIFTASAADVSIGSVAEWNAAAGTIASGSTVTLTADIDFEGAEAAPLVPASAGAVVLNFNGQGYAIKNATASAPLIAGILTATDTGGNPGTDTVFANATKIQNVTFEGITMSASDSVALAVGTLTGNSMDFVFENIKVVDCDVTSTAGSAAALVATHETGANGSYNEATVAFTNVTIDADTTITGAVHAAGALAFASGVTGGNYISTNVYVAGTITSTFASAAGTANKYDFFVGGILGYLAPSAASRSMSASFENCVVKASLILANANDADDGAVGGLIGYAMLGNGSDANPFPTFTFNNVAVDLANYTSTISKLSAFANLHNSVHFVFNYEGTNFAKNAPANELYLMYASYYNGSKDDANFVSAGTKANLDVKNLFKVTFDEDGFIASITEVDASNCPHEWSDYVDVTPATKYESGVARATCEICGSTDDKVTPALGFAAADLQADYANITTLVLNSVADWNAVATSGLTFAGKTIVLGADIDFENAAAAPLVPASLGATTMKFDGQGFAIKNATASAPLIAGILTATGTGANPADRMDADLSDELASANSIKNVTFENITLTASVDVALAVGTLTGNSMDFIFENIKVVNCDVTSTAGSAAAIVANHERGTSGSWARSLLVVKNVTIDADTTITALNNVGGIFANATGATHGAYSFENIYVAATITQNGANTSGYGRIGGLFGYSQTVAINSNRANTYLFENVAIVGSLITENVTGHNGSLGGLFGYACGCGTFNVNNVIVAPATVTSGLSYKFTFGYMQSYVTVIYYENFYTGGAMLNSNEFICDNGVSLFTAGAAEGDANFVGGGKYTNLPNIAPIDATVMAKVLVMEDGFVSTIKEVVRASGYQKGNIGDETYSIRFLGLAQLADLTEANNVNMKIVATYAGGSRTFDTSSENCTDAAGNKAPGAILYDGLTVHNEYGIATETVYAETLGAEKIAGFTIYNIPKQAITFTVTLSYVNNYGVTIESAPLVMAFDANGVGPADAQ